MAPVEGCMCELAIDLERVLPGRTDYLDEIPGVSLGVHCDLEDNFGILTADGDIESISAHKRGSSGQEEPLDLNDQIKFSGDDKVIVEDVLGIELVELWHNPYQDSSVRARPKPPYLSQSAEAKPERD